MYPARTFRCSHCRVWQLFRKEVPRKDASLDYGHCEGLHVELQRQPGGLYVVRETGVARSCGERFRNRGFRPLRRNGYPRFMESSLLSSLPKLSGTTLVVRHCSSAVTNGKFSMGFTLFSIFIRYDEGQSRRKNTFVFLVFRY